MTRKILITGGPVHAYLDAVKLVTNRFKGGRMAELARDFANSFDCQVTYLCAKGSTLPATAANLTVVTHDGFDEYERKVLALAAEHTDVVLGAAVANLIPANPWKGKFPSHNYKPGDIVSVDFKVAPRIIDQVKLHAPKANLFGFKLLSNVEHDELVRAAYGIVLEAHAVAVIANDTRDLAAKYVVTKERGVHPVQQPDLAAYLWQLMNDSYYSTAQVAELPDAYLRREALIAYAKEIHASRPGFFVEVEPGYVFGTVARKADAGFWTTARGKRELEDAVQVVEVDHAERRLRVAGPRKATLNAPLLARIFEGNSRVHTILHGHLQYAGLPTQPYAPPGSVRDTERDVSRSFNVAEHGCFLLLDAAGNQI